MLLPALQVEKEGSLIPLQILSGRGGTTLYRSGPIAAAGVQGADIQPQSLDHARTSALSSTQALSRSRG
jgi:hypothetical protein